MKIKVNRFRIVKERIAKISNNYNSKFLFYRKNRNNLTIKKSIIFNKNNQIFNKDKHKNNNKNKNNQIHYKVKDKNKNKNKNIEYKICFYNSMNNKIQK